MTTILTITGMSCEHCVRRVSAALSAVPGVGNADVSLDGNPGSAAVEHDGSVTRDLLAAAVEKAGYTVG